MNILYHHRTRGEEVEGVHIRSIVKALVKLGNNVIVLSPPGVDPMVDLSFSQARQVPLKKVFLMRFWRHICLHMPEVIFEVLEVFYNLLMIFRMPRIIKRNNIDFIYERYAMSLFASILIALMPRCKIPIILEVNDSAYVERVRKLLIKPLARFLERRIFQRTDALVVITKRFKEIIIEKDRILPKKVYVIPNACDVELFDPERYKGGTIRRRYNIEDRVVLGYVGAFVYWHELDLLVKVMPALLKANERIHFLFVGAGKDFKGVASKIARKGLRDTTTFTGRVLHKEIPGYLAAMDIGILPGSSEYASPVKLFEYMAMAVVPVVPRLSAIEEIIKDGVNGLLFEAGNAHDMKQRILELAGDDKKRKAVGSNARDTILRKHQWQHNARRILSIYRSIQEGAV